MSEETEVKTEVETFTAEQVEEMLNKAKAEVAQPYLGMEKNYQKLLSETKEAKRLAQEAQEIEAKKSGDIESLEKYHAEAIGKKDSMISELQNAMTGSANNAFIADLMGMFKDESQALAKAWIQDKLQSEYSDGAITTKFLDAAGGLVSTDAGSYKEYLKGVDFLQSHLKGVQMNGGGAAGSQTGSGAVAKKFADYSSGELVEIKRQNPEFYQKLLNNR